MRTCFRTSLLCYLMLLVFSDTAEALFFHYPKQVLMDFLEKLGGHKPMTPIHHYHMHYYPLPVPLLLPKPVPLPPPKIEIDLSSLHSSYGPLHSLDWPSYGRANIHDPEAVPPESHALPSWTDHDQQWDKSETFEKDHEHKEAKPPRILVQVPFHQRIVLYQPPAKEAKSRLLKTFLSKLRRINDAVFHPEDDYAEEHQHSSPAVINNSLAYAT